MSLSQSLSVNALLMFSFTVTLIVISLPLFTNPQPWLFIDGVNLIFHEAGHLIFSIMVDWVSRWGGTMMQLLVPLLVLIAFLWQQSWFSAAFSLWWIVESLINIAVYFKDASAQTLPLIGGDHDWFFTLMHLNFLHQDQLSGGGVLLFCRLLVATGLTICLLFRLFSFPTRSNDHST